MELILSLLPLPSLLRAQAISKSWRDLIADSTTLQHQLFLKPEKSSKIWLVQVANLPAQLRPLPRNFKSSLRVLTEVPANSRILETWRGLVATPVRINRLFLEPDPFLDDPGDVDQKVDSGFVAQFNAPEDLLQNISNHSIGDMLLTQPPVTNLCVEVLVTRSRGEPIAVGLTFRTGGQYRLYSAKIFEAEGIRLRHVAEAMEKEGILDHLDRSQGIKLFMSGVIEASEEDFEVVRERTEEWEQAKKDGMYA